MDDIISRQAAIDALCKAGCDSTYCGVSCPDVMAIESLPSARPQYEELTPEEAVSEIASGSIMSAWYWVDMVIRLKQMGYAICKKR